MPTPEAAAAGASLRQLQRAAAQLANMPPRTPPTTRTPIVSGEETSTGEVAAEPTPEEKRLARLSAIERIVALANKMNKPVSEKLLAERDELLAQAPSSTPEVTPEAPVEAQA